MKIIDKYKYIRSNFSCYGFFESISISLKPFEDEYDLQEITTGNCYFIDYMKRKYGVNNENN